MTIPDLPGYRWHYINYAADPERPLCVPPTPAADACCHYLTAVCEEGAYRRCLSAGHDHAAGRIICWFELLSWHATGRASPPVAFWACCRPTIRMIPGDLRVLAWSTLPQHITPPSLAEFAAAQQPPASR